MGFYKISFQLACLNKIAFNPTNPLSINSLATVKSISVILPIILVIIFGIFCEVDGLPMVLFGCHPIKLKKENLFVLRETNGQIKFFENH